jgi:hypothetical protein
MALWLKALGGVPPSEDGRQSIVTLHHRVANVIRPELDRPNFMRTLLDEWPDAVGTVEALHRHKHRGVPRHVKERLRRPHPGYVVRHLADFLDWYDDHTRPRTPWGKKPWWEESPKPEERKVTSGARLDF